jgi:hypothetical protein
MAGPISVTLEREPSFFRAAELDGQSHQTITGRDPGGHLIGLATRSTGSFYLNGTAARAGYLSQLRLHPSARGSFHIVTRGYRFLKDLHDRDQPGLTYLTSIMEDNTPARRLLESGRRGLPTYTALARFETSILSHARSTRSPDITIRPATPADIPTLASILHESNHRFAFAPTWPAAALEALDNAGLPINRFLIAERARRPVACAALWDQRPFKQSVVRAYSPTLSITRPLINTFARVRALPSLPPIGQPLPTQFLSHAAALPGEEHAFEPLVAAALKQARHEGCSLIAGFAASHPLAPVMSRFRRRVLPSILYAVAWDDGKPLVASLRTQVPHAEVALL